MISEESELVEAWRIINVLAMHYLDDGETYPKALEWLERNKEFTPSELVTGAVKESALETGN